MQGNGYLWDLVTERELAELSNEILERFPDVDMETGRMLLLIEIQEFAAKAQVAAVLFDREIDAAEEGWGEVEDIEGPNTPCNYCSRPGVGCEECPCPVCRAVACSPTCRFYQPDWGGHVIKFDRSSA